MNTTTIHLKPNVTIQIIVTSVLPYPSFLEARSSHVDDTADALATVHVMEALIDVRELPVVRNVFVDLELATEVV